MKTLFTRLALMPCAAALFLTQTTSAQGLGATIASQSGEFAAPLDATPDPDGANFYFTGVGPGGSSVFRVPSTGGAATLVAGGAPFVSPIGISISGDGRRLYVADPRAWAGAGKSGQIFVVPSAGGAVTRLAGAEGRASRAVEVVSEGGADMVYFSGLNPESQLPGIYKVPAAGAAEPVTVFEGSPLIEPGGIAVSRNGVVYITDRDANSSLGSVSKIEDGAISQVVGIIRPGHPAGVALSLDDSTLLVSTQQPYRNRAQVLIVDLSTSELSVATQGVDVNPDAGGLHRARNAPIYAWCGSPHGPIYKIMNSMN